MSFRRSVRLKRSHIRHRQKRGGKSPSPADVVMVAVSNRPLSEWDKSALVQYAKDKGIRANSRWGKDTIIRKIEELNDGTIE